LHRLTRTIAVLAIAVLAFAITGCGEKSETTNTDDIRPDRLVLLLDWYPNANHAGIYTGIQDGAFTSRALQIDPKVPSDASGIIKQVAAGRADLGLTYASYVLTAREQGAGVKAIASVVNTPLNSLIWLKKSKIKSIKDLKGKTVGVSGDGESATLNTILEKNDVDPKTVKQINVNMGLQQALVSGKVDATITGYWNVEGVQLKLAGLKPTVVPVDKAGSPTYDELVVIANEENLKDSRRVETYRRFIAGLQQGTQDAVAHPAKAFAALSAKYPDLKKTADDREFNEASLKVTLPILAQTNIGDNPFGWLDPSTWANYGKWMKDNGELSETGVNYTDAIDNTLLPGVTPDDGSGATESGGEDIK
jgi:putative hydroxymethylpyrimidine transport system substrate-binding protein